MQNITQQQRAARKQAQHYNESVDFLGMMEAGSFDEEVEDGTRWVGLTRDEAGILQVYAEFVWDEGKDSGTGWWL
jgi:hypothetical protein